MARRRKNQNTANKNGKQASANSRGKSCFVIIIGDDGAILILMKGKTVVRRLFAPSALPEQVRSFVDLMQSHPHAPVYVLLDIIDQSYSKHSLPPVSSLSVNKLVQRRLEREYSPKDITGYISLGRETGGRKDWNFLLISVSATEVLTQWLDLIQETSNPFKGIYLSPVESQSYIKEICNRLPDRAVKSAPEWVLMVSHNKVSGFRQVVMHRDKLVFTRLAHSMGEGLPEVVAGNIEQEVLNTIEYLRRLGYNEQAGMEVIIISGQDVKAEIDTKKLNVAKTYLFTPYEMAQHLSLQHAALNADRYGDVTIATFFGASRKKHLKLNNAYGKTLQKIDAASKGIKLGGSLAVVGLLSISGMDGYNYYSHSDEISGLENKLRIQEAELSDTRKILDQLPADVSEIAHYITLDEVMSQNAFYPIPFIEAISEARDNNIIIKSIDWIYADPISSTGRKVQTSTNRLRGVAHNEKIGDLPLQFTVVLEFLLDNPDRNLFISKTTEFLDKVKTSLPNFEMEYTRLPGIGEDSENIEINFDDTASLNDLLEGDSFEVELLVTGPSEKKVATDGKKGRM